MDPDVPRTPPGERLQMPAPVARQDWCPGTLRPMQSGDGLIVRLRITGGIVATQLAEDIGQWARQWGNGQIDLSGRANLHLRGLSPRTLPELHVALARWKLLDSTAAGEAVRNVVCTPLAGLDPDARLDIRPIARHLEQRLVDDAALHALPAKFGFAIDDGGLASLEACSADIRFVARRAAGQPVLDIYLAGAPDTPLGPCSPSSVSVSAAALARVFLADRTGRETVIRRMRDLVDARGAARIGREAGFSPIFLPGPALSRAGAADPSDLLGPQPLGRSAFLGVGLPFGRIAAEDLALLAAAAAANGGETLRLTPWRAIFAPVPSIQAARALAAALPEDRFIFDPGDRRRRIAACPGAPACARATTAVREDAALLAAALTDPGQGIALHVSGCEKGCAHPRSAPVTLTAQHGRYHFIRNGTASDPPVRRDLSLDLIAAQLKRDGVRLTQSRSAMDGSTGSDHALSQAGSDRLQGDTG